VQRIDIDCIETDRPKIFKYIINRFGERKTARVPSFGTLQEKGTIKGIGNALAKYWEEEKTGVPFKPSDKFSPDNPYSLSNIDEIISEFFADEQSARKNHPDIFQYYDGLLDTKISQSVHPAGIVISPITLDDAYGVFDKDGDLCLMIDMDELHEVGAAKFDFLILSNIGIINETCRLAGIPYPHMHEINFNDQKVWADMLRSPAGIFQMESPFAFSMLKKFVPHSIFDMNLITAAVRPSGASYRDKLMNKIPNKNPTKEIDKLLENNLGYLIFQEDIIAFLQQICGLSGSEADNVRRAIGRKDAERLEGAMPKILEGYCKNSDKPREEAEKDAKTFLKVIEDASEYSFGYNHATEYSLIGYLCAYLRCYYPCEFITAYLNNAANEDDVINGTTLAAEYGFKVTPPRFGASRDVFYFNKEKKEIAKGLTSVKYMSAALANELYDIYDEVKGKSFMEVLKALSKTSIDARQLDILIKIGYFEEFGNMGELLKLVQVYSFFKNGTAKSVSKSKVVGFLTDIISDYATDKGVKGNELKSYTITDMDGLLAACEEQIRKSNVPDLTLKVKIQNSIDYLGYVGIQTGRPEDRRKLLIMDVFPMRGQDGVPWGYRINTQSLGTGKQSSLTIPARLYNGQQVAKGDVVYAENCYKNPKGYWYLNSYRKI
jgi:DNA polymerase-3 subunit alpha